MLTFYDKPTGSPEHANTSKTDTDNQHTGIHLIMKKINNNNNLTHHRYAITPTDLQENREF